MKTLSKQPKSQKPLRLWPTYQKDGKPWSVKVGIVCLEDSGNVAIARAVPKDAPLLVLDEATSAVDNETEAALQRSIERISRRPHDDCDRPQAFNGTPRRPNPCAGRRKGR